LTDILLLWAIAIPMALAIAWVSKKSANARNPIDNGYVIYLLVMMAGMFGGAAFYLLNPTVTSLVEAFGVNMGLMTAGVSVVLTYWARDNSSLSDLHEASPPIALNDAAHRAPYSQTIPKEEDLGLQRAIRLTRDYAIFFISMFASMTAIGLLYIVNPSRMGIEISLGTGMSIMTLGVILIVWDASKRNEFALAEQTIDNTVNLPITRSSLVRGIVISLILLNEVLMGWVFVLESGSASPVAGLSMLSMFSYVIGSYWFIFIMVIEMAFTIYAFKDKLSKGLVFLLAFQAGVMLLSPTALESQIWVSASVFIGTSLMTILFVFMFEYLSRNNSISRTLANYYLALLTVYALMMGGLYLWKIDGDELLFAASIVIEMAVYFDLIIRSGKISSEAKKTSWLLDAKWTFGVLSTLFVAEFFMGALLDAQINGPQSLIQRASLVSLVGGPLGVVGGALYDFVSFFGSVTASPWFLIMMGTEMGALVVFRIGSVRELETKVRLAMVVVAYAVYAIALPSFLIPSSILPKVPFVGWSMGVGTGGPVAPTLLVALLGTYLVSGVLSFLFGSRQVCSMFCTAALMYQGTFYDKMKTFNRSSKIGRKYLSSRLSGLYKATFSLVWGSLIIAIAISYLDSIGLINISIFGSDPSTFLYTFYFGFLWYVIFFTIPFVGTYGCVSMGWCHWGTFNQLVSRLGFFKVKVRDPNACLNCATKDCARACPVGLTDLPRQFISKSEFKNHKCIGVGDCVSSCPYENEYFYDVRHWLKLKIVKTGDPRRELPVIGYNTMTIQQNEREI
jgi:polyferredoxin